MANREQKRQQGKEEAEGRQEQEAQARAVRRPGGAGPEPGSSGLQPVRQEGLTAAKTRSQRRRAPPAAAAGRCRAAGCDTAIDRHDDPPTVAPPPARLPRGCGSGARPAVRRRAEPAAAPVARRADLAAPGADRAGRQAEAEAGTGALGAARGQAGPGDDAATAPRPSPATRISDRDRPGWLRPQHRRRRSRPRPRMRSRAAARSPRTPATSSSCRRSSRRTSSTARSPGCGGSKLNATILFPQGPQAPSRGAVAERGGAQRHLADRHHRPVDLDRAEGAAARAHARGAGEAQRQGVQALRLRSARRQRGDSTGRAARSPRCRAAARSASGSRPTARPQPTRSRPRAARNSARATPRCAPSSRSSPRSSSGIRSIFRKSGHRFSVENATKNRI